MDVELKDNIRFRDQKFKKGTIISLPEAVGRDLVSRGIAKEVKRKVQISMEPTTLEKS